MIIIGISGQKYSGKDTIFRYIKEQLNPATTVRVGFADALKKEVATATGVTAQYVEDHKATFRPILQWWGTDFRRNMHGKDYWVARLLHTIAREIPINTTAVVVPDVRFRNEADILRQAGAHIIRVWRPSDGNDPHPSETELTSENYPYDVVIANNGTLQDLQSATRAALARLGLLRPNGVHPHH